MQALRHPQEAHRLQSLRDHRILDTPSEAAFDQLVRLAARCIGTPVVAVNFVDDARVWCKAVVGADAIELPRDAAVCAHAILEATPLIIPDLATDARTAGLPMVVAGPRYRFYAGAPVVDGDRLPLGTLLLLDTAPRTLSSEQQEILVAIAEQVAGQLKHRRRENRRRAFVATLAHELRNPLAPMRTVIEVLRRNGAQDQLSEWGREVMERQVDHLSRLVDDLMDVSLAVEGQMSLRVSRISLADLTQRTSDTVRPVLEVRSQKLRIEGAPRDAFIIADPVRMAQVLINLVGDSSALAPADCSVDLVVATHADSVTFEISAPRASNEVLGLVGPQVPQAPLGQGVAMTLARRLIEMHDGQLQTIPRDPDSETRFLVTLRHDAAAEAHHAPHEGVDDSSYTRHPRKILVIDDNSDQAEALGMLIGIWGHDVRVAADGPGALAQANEFQPDMVLCDITLPGMDGYEVARRLIATGRPMLLAALTGHGLPADRQKSAQAGFHHHLTKPVDPAVLQRLLESGSAFPSGV